MSLKTTVQSLAPTKPPEQVQPQADAQATPAQEAVSDEILFNKAEVVELRKEMREAAKSHKEVLSAIASLRTQAKPTETVPAEKAQPVDYGAEIAGLKRTLALTEAYNEFSIPVGEGRQIIEKMVTLDRPEDVRAYVEKYAATFAKKPVIETVTPAVKPAGKSDTGAPAASGADSLPDDPRLIDRSIWSSMPKDERQRRYQGWLSRGGINVNPFLKRN